MIKFSIIIPVYNRSDEVAELLASLTQQTYRDYEIIIVEDGSSVPCETVVKQYAYRLPVNYYMKPNSGPGQSRNYGAERAKGEYLLIWDSDILIPQGYFEAIETFLQTNPVDAFGGPDRAHESFTDVQKAINYSMTSFFTTGGIRGGKKKLDKFFPRSFNMGIRRTVYEQLGGFRAMRFGEDIDFSYRIVEAGYKTALIPDAYVYHKRRTDFRKFFRQVHNSGIARINLSILHPGTLKPVHTLPALFTLAVIPFMPFMPIYALLVFVDATIQNRSMKIGALSVVAAFTQLIGYGTGFIIAAIRRWVLKKENKDAFTANFYK
jgi:glycosyltransferase involved in cell wall biosynthesis